MQALNNSMASCEPTLPLGSGTSRPKRLSLPVVQKYLALQQELTAVEDFSRFHDDHRVVRTLASKDMCDVPEQAQYYRALMPLSSPGPGEQYAFEVNLDACTGCKACVTGCHSLNGLSQAETWRQVGLLHTATGGMAIQQTVTAACHHCVEPACLKGCPVDAYEKDPVTGIVLHLDDQCIGCQYCTFTCPYEVPQFEPRLGIVRKCDMCHGRLAANEAPACVQACPNEAIAIRTVRTDDLQARAAREHFLPTAPSPKLTKPSTLYVSKRELPDTLVAADGNQPRPSSPHTPLSVTLVLSQLAFGLAMLAVVAWSVTGAEQAALWLLVGTAVVEATAVLVSLGHLGRPAYAFRVVLGLGHSWLSREAVALGFAVKLLSAAAVATHLRTWLGEHQLFSVGAPWLGENLGATLTMAGAVAAGTGVISSAMLYAVTGKQVWALGRSLSCFMGTTLLTAGTASMWLATVLAGWHWAFWPSFLMALAGVLLKLEVESQPWRRGGMPWERMRALLRGPLSQPFRWRLLSGGVAVVLLALAATAQMLFGAPATPMVSILAACAALAALAGELLERMLFFTAAPAPRMPGAVGP